MQQRVPLLQIQELLNKPCDAGFSCFYLQGGLYLQGMTQEDIEQLGAKVAAGKASDEEELLFLDIINQGLDELIKVADTFPEAEKDTEEVNS